MQKAKTHDERKTALLAYYKKLAVDGFATVQDADDACATLHMMTEREVQIEWEDEIGFEE